MRTRLVFILIALLALTGYAFWRSPYHQVRSLFTLVTIDVPANRVWDMLTDLNGYKSWNPFLTSASGTLAPEQEITVAARLGQHTITFHPRIVSVEPGKKLAWRGTLLFPAILTGEHEFELEPLDQSHTRLIQSEHFRGVLVGFLWNRFSPQLTQGFNAMNQALKRHCEQAEHF
jgi:hypothetical protein